MLGRIDVKVAGFTVYSKEIGFKSVDRAIKNFTDNIEKIKSVADGSAFDPEKIAKNAKSRAISSFRAKLPKSSLKVYDDLVGLSKSVKKSQKRHDKTTPGEGSPENWRPSSRNTTGLKRAK